MTTLITQEERERARRQLAARTPAEKQNIRASLEAFARKLESNPQVKVIRNDGAPRVDTRRDRA